MSLIPDEDRTEIETLLTSLPDQDNSRNETKLLIKQTNSANQFEPLLARSPNHQRDRLHSATVGAKRRGWHCFNSSDQRRANVRLKMVCSKRRSALARDFVTNSTFHGLYDVYRSNNRSLKFVWTVIFVAGLGAATYECFAIISAYLESPVVVSYIVQENASLPLPDIVFCPPNRLNKSFLMEHNITREMADFIELAFFATPLLPFQIKKLGRYLYSWDNFSVLEEDQKHLDAKLNEMNISFEDFLQIGEIHCSAYVEHFSLLRRHYNSCEQLPSYMTSSGRCYRLPSPRQENDGYGKGASASLKLPRHLYTTPFNNLPIDGVYIKLAQMTDSDLEFKPGTANRGVDQDFTLIPRGVFTVITLRSTRYEFRNDPPRFECNTQPEVGFSRVSCVDNCLSEEAEKKCNCSPAASANRKGIYSLCTPYVLWSCVARELSMKNSADRRELMCKERCRPMCSYWKFTPQISFAHMPAEEYKDVVGNDTAEWQDLHNRIVIEMYHEHLEYTLIKHFSSMSLDSFIAQIGGQISLWVGGSILTVVQLIVFLIQLSCPDKLPKKMSKTCQSGLANFPFRPKPSTNELMKNTVDERFVAVPVTAENCIDSYAHSMQNGNAKLDNLRARARAQDSVSTFCSGGAGGSPLRSFEAVI